MPDQPQSTVSAIDSALGHADIATARQHFVAVERGWIFYPGSTLTPLGGLWAYEVSAAANRARLVRLVHRWGWFIATVVGSATAVGFFFGAAASCLIVSAAAALLGYTIQAWIATRRLARLPARRALQRYAEHVGRETVERSIACGLMATAIALLFPGTRWLAIPFAAHAGLCMCVLRLCAAPRGTPHAK